MLIKINEKINRLYWYDTTALRNGRYRDRIRKNNRKTTKTILQAKLPYNIFIPLSLVRDKLKPGGSIYVYITGLRAFLSVDRDFVLYNGKILQLHKNVYIGINSRWLKNEKRKG